MSEAESARLADLRAELQEKEARLTALEERRTALATERESVKREFAEPLADREPYLDVDELLERFSLDELREKVNALSSERTSSLADVEPSIQSGDAPGVETAALSRDDREEVAELRSSLEDLAASSSRLAAHQREQYASRLAELTGKSVEAVLEEV